MSDSVGKYPLILGVSQCELTDMCSVDRVFVHALNTVKRIPRTGSARPPPTDRLKLYGLYKQSTEGDVEGLSQRPEGNDVESIAEREKWDAWHAHHSLSRTESKRRYISTLIETMHKYATTTPEARELVAELEFVWDQIKSNTASSPSSSPGQLARSHQQMMQPSYASLGQSGKGRDEGGGAGLRVLRPVSDGGAEEEEEEEGEEYEEARNVPFDEDEGAVAGASQGRDLDVRNRKWRKRVEQALVKMTTEVAALREQLEAKRSGEGKRRNGTWTWMCWLTWVAVRHLVVDLALMGVVLVWARRKGDRRVEQGLELLLGYVRERARKARVPRLLRGPARHA